MFDQIPFKAKKHMLYISPTIETFGTPFSILEAFSSLNNKCDSGMTWPKEEIEYEFMLNSKFKVGRTRVLR